MPKECRVARVDQAGGITPPPEASINPAPHPSNSSSFRAPRHRLDDPVLEALVTYLSSQPIASRHAIIGMFAYWCELRGEMRALVAKAFRPGLSDAEVARLAGVEPQSIRRWKKFRRLKDLIEARPSPESSKRRASRRNRWIDLPPNDREQ